MSPHSSTARSIEGRHGGCTRTTRGPTARIAGLAVLVLVLATGLVAGAAVAGAAAAQEDGEMEVSIEPMNGTLANDTIYVGESEGFEYLRVNVTVDRDGNRAVYDDQESLNFDWSGDGEVHNLTTNWRVVRYDFGDGDATQEAPLEVTATDADGQTVAATSTQFAVGAPGDDGSDGNDGGNGDDDQNSGGNFGPPGGGDSGEPDDENGDGTDGDQTDDESDGSDGDENDGDGQESDQSDQSSSDDPATAPSDGDDGSTDGGDDDSDDGGLGAATTILIVGVVGGVGAIVYYFRP